MEDKNIYEQKTTDVKKMLKVVHHEILKLSRIRLNTVFKPNLEMIDIESAINSTKESIATNEAAFIELCKEHFDKIFFYNDKLENDPSMKNLLNNLTFDISCFYKADDNEQKTAEDYLTEYKRFLKIVDGDENNILKGKKPSLYNDVEAAINNERLYYSSHRDYHIEELNKLKIKLKFVEKLRIFKKAEKALIKSINLKNNIITEDSKEIEGANKLAKMLDTSFESIISLNEIINSKTPNCYTQYQLYNTLLNEQKKIRRKLKSRLKKDAPQTQEIEDLKSRATLQKIVEETFDPKTIDELAQQPDLLIHLGRVSVEGTGDSVEDELIVPYLIEKYEKTK